MPIEKKLKLKSDDIFHLLTATLDTEISSRGDKGTFVAFNLLKEELQISFNLQLYIINISKLLRFFFAEIMMKSSGKNSQI